MQPGLRKTADPICAWIRETELPHIPYRTVRASPHLRHIYLHIILFHFGGSPSVAQMYPMQELGIRLYYDLEL